MHSNSTPMTNPWLTHQSPDGLRFIGLTRGSYMGSQYRRMGRLWVSHGALALAHGSIMGLSWVCGAT